jgi:3-oxoacyl-[acyl-carrier-protein] synthase II
VSGLGVTGPADAARVVVTGLGVVSSIAMGAASFAEALRAGRSGARPVGSFDTSGYDHAIACEVPDFVPDLARHAAHDVGRASQFAVAAARMAVADARLDEAALAARTGLVAIGTTDGESRDLDGLVGQAVADGPAAMDPRVARRVAAARLSTSTARDLGLTDVEAATLPTACAAGNYSIGYGLDALRAGDVDFALCGGADALSRKSFTGFYRLGAMAPQRCQPFDAARRGMLGGEGAAVLLLERLESARARGARVYAEILGYGLTCDADHAVAPNRESFARCMSLALADAGIGPCDVDVIFAHGTATQANDVAEAGAIRDVFGAHRPRVTGPKSMLGHALGAASALAAAACTLSVAHRFIPPTIHHDKTDPDCDIDCVANTAVDADVRIVQNNALAFGGNNAVVLIGRMVGPS